MEIPGFKYGGTAIFLIGTAYRLLRWAMGTIAEDDDPPDTIVDTSSALPGGRPLIVAPAHRPAKASDAVASGRDTRPSWMQTNDPDAPPQAGDPGLFPQAMLDAMTPEQRARVVETLGHQRTGR